MSMSFTGKGVLFFNLTTQLHAAKLQLDGMKHSSGRSVIAHCKRTYKLRGTNEFVVEQLEQMVEGAIASRAYQRGEEIDLQAKVNALPYAELQRAFIRGTQEFA